MATPVLVPGPSRKRVPLLAAMTPKAPRPSSPLAPFEHLEALAEQSEIVNFEQLHRQLAKPLPAGHLLEFTLQTKDSVQSQKTVGGDKWTVIVQALSSSHSFDAAVADEGNGLYRVTCKVTKSGKFNIDIRLHKCIVSSLISNEVITSLCPPTALTLTVDPGPVSAQHTQLIFDGGLARSFSIAPIAGRDGYFLVWARDEFGNSTSLRAEEVFQGICEDTDFRILRQDPFDAGVYKITYRTDKAGDFLVTVLLLNRKTHTEQTIAASPLKITVLPDKPHREACRLTAPPQYRAGEDAAYGLAIFDRFNNPVQDAMLSLHTDTKSLEFRRTVNRRADGQPGNYAVEFYTEKCFKYILKTHVVGNAGIEYDEPFELPVYLLNPLPGPLTVSNCFPTYDQLRGKVATTGVITLHKRDRFNNPINSDPFNKTESDDVFTLTCADSALRIDKATTNDNSTYRIEYHTTKAGTYILNAALGDVALEGGPFSLVIEPQVPDAATCFIEAPIAASWAGVQSAIFLVLRDQYGNLTSQQDPRAAPRVIFANDKDKLPCPVTYAEPVRFEPALFPSAVDVTSNVRPEAGRSLAELVNQDAAQLTDTPVTWFNVPPKPVEIANPLVLQSLFRSDPLREPELAPTTSYLQFDFGESAVSFVRCRLLACSEPQCSSYWAIEYSDNGSRWLEAAALLQVHGWSDATWEYLGEHRFWRLSCDNPGANDGVFPESFEQQQQQQQLAARAKRRVDLCGKPQPSGWLSVEWFSPCFGRATATYTRQRTKVYDIVLRIGEDIAGCCAGGFTFPLWINNVACAPRCTVDLLEAAENLVVRKEMSIQITLKDKFGFNRLVGSPADFEHLAVGVRYPTGKPATVAVRNNNNGTYTAKFESRIAGPYQLEIRFAGEPIPAPKVFAMLPAATEPAACLVEAFDRKQVTRVACHDCLAAVSTLYCPQFVDQCYCQPCFDARCQRGGLAAAEAREGVRELDLDGLVGGMVGRSSRFRILARDCFENPSVAGKDDFVVRITGTAFPLGFADDFPPLFAAVTYEADGYYTASYRLERAGEYLVEVALRRVVEEPEGGLFPIASFPVSMHCREVHAPACKLVHSNHKGSGKNNPAGEVINLEVSIRDCYGNPLPTGDGHNLTVGFYTPWEREEDRRKAEAEALRQQQEAAEAAAAAAAALVLPQPFGKAQPAAPQPPPPSPPPPPPPPDPVEKVADPSKVWVPVHAVPQVVITPLPEKAAGHYNVAVTAFHVGQYRVHLQYDGHEFLTYAFNVMPTAPQAARCRVVSLAPEVVTCIECDTYAAMYFCRICNQSLCDKDWKVRHSNRNRAHHQRTLLGVDDKRHKIGETVCFGIFTQDAYDNPIVIPETSHIAVEAVMEFREYQPEPKGRKEKMSKKRAQPITVQVKSLEGEVFSLEMLLGDSIVTLKRRVFEKEGLPSNVQKLMYNGKLMEDNKSLADFALTKTSIINLELSDVEAHNQFPAELVNLGRGVWQAQFTLRGYGQYCLQLKVGPPAPVKELYRFILEQPLEEPKGKVAQKRLMEEMLAEIEDLRGRLGLSVSQLLQEKVRGGPADHEPPAATTDDEGPTKEKERDEEAPVPVPEAREQPLAAPDTPAVAEQSS